MKNPSQRNEIVGCRGGKAPDIMFASIHVMEDLDSKDLTGTFPILKDHGHMLPSQIECHPHGFQGFRIIDAGTFSFICSLEQ
jgi:hypothetical protein